MSDKIADVIIDQAQKELAKYGVHDMAVIACLLSQMDEPQLQSAADMLAQYMDWSIEQQAKLFVNFVDAKKDSIRILQAASLGL